MDKQYYPYRKHLRWAFEKLPVASRVMSAIDIIAYSPDWDKKVASLKAIKEIYKAYIEEKHILTPELLEDLMWATRAQAWSNPGWRDRLVKCRRQAEEAGYDPGDGWVWSLWGWT